MKFKVRPVDDGPDVLNHAEFIALLIANPQKHMIEELGHQPIVRQVSLDLGQGVEADGQTVLTVKGAPCRQREFVKALQEFALEWRANFEQPAITSDGGKKPCGCKDK